MQDARKPPRQRAVSGLSGQSLERFFMSLRAAACAVHNLCVQAPLTLRGICNGQRTRNRYCNLCHPHVMTISYILESYY